MIDYKIINPNLKPTLVFVHGVASNMNSFAPCIEHFKKDYRILALSMRGHGKSDCPQPESRKAYSVKEMAHDVMEIIKTHDIRSFHYVGHSMGGIIGYELLRSNRDPFITFTACSSPAEIKIPIWIAMAGTSPFMVFPEKIIDSVWGEVIARFSGKTDISRRIIREDVVPYINWKVMRHCLVNLSNISYLDVLKELKVPFLLVHGQYDVYNIYMKPMLKILNGKENFHHEYMKGAGHNANIDYPERFNKTVESFIKNYN